MKNNRGFTLIELIVVIAVLAIIAGISGGTMGSVSKQELKDFVNAYDAMLSECKIETLSGMNNPYLRIVNEENEYRAVLYEKSNGNGSGGTIVKKQYLGEDYLTCKYYKADGTEIQSNSLTIWYDRTTGAMKTNLAGVVKVSVSNKKGMTYSVELIPQTGYHRVAQ